jgi:hypothetical protein
MSRIADVSRANRKEPNYFSFADYSSRARHLSNIRFFRCLCTKRGVRLRMLLPKDLSRDAAEPASPCAMERRRLRISKQVRHFGNRERCVLQVCFSGCPARLVAEGVKRCPSLCEAPLESAWCDSESPSHSVEAQVTDRGLRRQNADNFLSYIAVLWLTRDDFCGLAFKEPSQRGIPSTERYLHCRLRQGPPIP